MDALFFTGHARKRKVSIDEPLVSNNNYLYSITQPKSSYLKKFLKFADEQQPNSYGWLGLALFAHGCVLAPVTILCIVFSGNSLALWIPCILVFTITEIVNLAALPTKITIPIFFASIIVDILIIAISLFLIFNH